MTFIIATVHLMAFKTVPQPSLMDSTFLGGGRIGAALECVGVPRLLGEMPTGADVEGSLGGFLANAGGGRPRSLDTVYGSSYPARMAWSI